MPKYMPIIFFYFLKIIFYISTSKRSKRYKPHLILAKKKKKKFTEKQSQTLPKLAILPFTWHLCPCLRSSFDKNTTDTVIFHTGFRQFNETNPEAQLVVPEKRHELDAWRDPCKYCTCVRKQECSFKLLCVTVWPGRN
jgi:hypothetical protein